MPELVSELPASNQVPGVFVNIDNTLALGVASQVHRVLILGYAAAGQGQVTQILGADEAETVFGASPLTNQIRKFREGDGTAPLFAIAIPAPSAGVAEIRTISFSGTATAAGNAVIRLNGTQEVGSVPVESGDTGAEIAQGVVDLINTWRDRESTIAYTPGQASFTSTANTASAQAGDHLSISFYEEDESLPAGISATNVITTPGAGVPDLDTAAFDLLGDTQYKTIINPFTDAANVERLRALLQDRFELLNQADGTGFMALSGTVAAGTTAVSALNSQILSYTHFQETPTPAHLLASVAGAKNSSTSQRNVGEPRTGAVTGVARPLRSTEFDYLERNTLLLAGVSTVNYNSQGQADFERMVTTYITNSVGTTDRSYQEVSAVDILSRIRFDIRTTFEPLRDRRLTDDATRTAPGIETMSPDIADGYLLTLFDVWESNAWVTDKQSFADRLVTRRSLANRNRLDSVASPELTSEYLITAVDLRFRK